MPSPRSGHAMCLDLTDAIVYVHGGYNSDKCLDDFWSYDIREDEWQKISDSTSCQSGPSPRSCHKMVFDTKTGNIYVLGRLTDVDSGRALINRRVLHNMADIVLSSPQRPAQAHSSLPPLPPHPTTDPPAVTMLCSEFYMYHTRGPTRGTWTCISSDTSVSVILLKFNCEIKSTTQVDGGPPLVFDHQMVFDSERQILYVSGGRVIGDDWDTYKYAGLYAYTIKTAQWKLLQ